MDLIRDTERPVCCRCGAPASEFDPRSLGCFCRACALERAETLLEALDDGDKLDCAGFEPLTEF